MKTVFITGTSSGIGRESAKLFQKMGWNVIATMLNPAEETELNKLQNLELLQCDVTNLDSIKAAVSDSIAVFKKIDVLVNNAGIYTTDPLEQVSDETINAIVETNIKGTLFTTKAIIEHFRKNKSGTIVNISSIAGRVTFPFQSIYHTSKWAIEGFSESLYYELKPLNIKVKIVEPGMVKTNIYDSVMSFPFEQYPDEYKIIFKKWHNYLMKNYKNGYSPALDAKTIYRAANSRGSKLRYTSDFTTKAVFFLRSILPLPIFQNIIKAIST